MNRGANVLIRSTAADIAPHHFVDIGIARVGLLRQQRRGLHDLPGLAVPALRHVAFGPGDLHRMACRSADSPSMVVTPLPAMLETGVMQDRVACPLICTVHAPHNAMPQPNFVPVMPSVSRRYQRRGISPTTSAVCAFPFSVNLMDAMGSV